MAKSLNFVVGVIGLLLISTLGYSGTSSGANLSKTYVTSVDINHSFVTAVSADFSFVAVNPAVSTTFVSTYASANHQSFAIIVDNRWEPLVLPKYGKPINAPKPDNTIINGKLKYKYSWLRFDQYRS